MLQMSYPPQQHRTRDLLTSYFWSGDAIRSRRVSDIVLTGTVDVPVLPARLLADWERETSSRLVLEPGDVEAMPLARARARWPDYKRCVQAMSDWTCALGLPEVLASSDVALMACRGAKYHHDGAQYGGAAFCNLFLSEDKGLTRPQVLRAITMNSSYELHQDQALGSLEVGKIADLIVIDRNFFDIPADEIAAIQVLQTVVGGRVVYESDKFTQP